MEKNAKIYVAGHRGMVGSAIVRELQRQGYTNIITRTHKELDLTRQDAVEEFFAQEKPEYVFLAAAKVGGIVANQEALADFMYDNMTLEMNAKKCNADLLLATDPDCDRVGIAVKNKAGEYELLTGNQTGMLLLDYICSQRLKHGRMPADPVMVKTIVTMDMGEQIATHYGLRTINVLTGFKFIDNICTFCAKALFLELCVYYKTLAGKLHPRTC